MRSDEATSRFSSGTNSSPNDFSQSQNGLRLLGFLQCNYRLSPTIPDLLGYHEDFLSYGARQVPKISCTNKRSASKNNPICQTEEANPQSSPYMILLNLPNDPNSRIQTLTPDLVSNANWVLRVISNNKVNAAIFSFQLP